MAQVHPFDVAVHQPHHASVRRVRILQITVAQGGLVFEGSSLRSRPGSMPRHRRPIG